MFNKSNKTSFIFTFIFTVLAWGMKLSAANSEAFLVFPCRACPVCHAVLGCLCVQVELYPVTAACKVQVRVSFSGITLDPHPGISGSKTQAVERASSGLGNICWYVREGAPGRSVSLTLCQACCICRQGWSLSSILTNRLHKCT